MHIDEAHHFVQMMMMIRNQYQQTLSAQMLDAFWQLTQDFSLIYVQQALQAYQQQTQIRHILPNPVVIRHLLANKIEQSQGTSDKGTDHITFVGNHQQAQGNLSKCTNVHPLRNDHEIKGLFSEL